MAEFFHAKFTCVPSETLIYGKRYTSVSRSEMKIPTAMAATPARHATHTQPYSHNPNPLSHADSSEDHVSPDTSKAFNSKARPQSTDDAFDDIYQTLNHGNGLVQFIQLGQIADDYSNALTHLEPADFNINAPPSFEPLGPAATPTITQQRSIQPRISFTEPTNDMLGGRPISSTSIIRSFSDKLTGTLRWAATVALPNQHYKSQGHSPLQLNNELAYRMHRNLGFGSTGTSRTH